MTTKIIINVHHTYAFVDLYDLYFLKTSQFTNFVDASYAQNLLNDSNYGEELAPTTLNTEESVWTEEKTLLFQVIRRLPRGFCSYKKKKFIWSVKTAKMAAYNYNVGYSMLLKL